MSDPSLRLDRFRMDAPAPTMRPPADVRRRGDEIRRRTRLLVGGAVAALAVIVALPVIALTVGIGAHGIDPAPAPSGGVPLSTANLLSADDVGTGWVIDYTERDEGTQRWHECATQSLTALGAVSVIRRAFAHGTGTSPTLFERAVEFRSPGAAKAAYRRIRDMWETCGQHSRLIDKGETVRRSLVTDPTQIIQAPGDARLDDFEITVTDASTGKTRRWDADTSVIRSGRRIAITQFTRTGADDYSIVPLPPIAAQRLVRGTGADRTTLTPLGLGDLRLGTTLGQAEASKAITRVTPPRAGGCGTFDLAGTKDDPTQVDGYISPQGKIVAIYGGKGITTPEGIGRGSTRAATEKAYPRGHLDNGQWVVRPPGFGDRSYEFAIEQGDVLGDIALVADGAAGVCFG